ncbi:ABC transporter related protein [Solidesulfovibrio carbinoliphilus subsp. oakridgensis]|uniref:ABC transporter related protein n=1 Tax=Solidesulfovibrio carbinoliphilus subsp. oakridgensis TaxID=694327 RepID=G7Q5P1_9BACT|nr:ABC-F family ATP-binding cassette domain-containing protein [Solidesulfovibrio carbinoliphilus]EHJ49600.1 ABC transporter related protein [Solidesulfovibrio carbinoliphilus subsp. oakridgensis]
MAKVSLQQLSKSYGGRDLFKDFSLEIPAGTRLAVVGQNGAGKSTLLKLIAGVSEPDGGRVVLSTGARLGYVAQEMEAGDLGMTLLAWVMAALPSWKEFWVRYDAAVAAGDQATLAVLAAEQTSLEHALGYNPEYRAKTILTGLGFSDESQHAPISDLSGGWRERAKLARVLTAGADVLLLDEPTNHLDLEAVAWLESFLCAFAGVLVFVAHDRIFLDRVATHTLFTGEGKPVWRPGSFTQFLAWREEMDKQWERQAAAIDSKIKQVNAFADRFRYKATKARQAQSKLKSKDKLEKELSSLKSERPDVKGRTLNFTLPEPEKSDKTVAAAADLSYAYPDRAPIWPPLTFQLFRGQKVALVGHNGAGKTTLLKLVVGALKPASGRVLLGTGVKLGYFSQHQTEILNTDALVMAEMRRMAGPKATHLEVCSILGLFLLGEDYWERRVSELSGGEKSRLVLAGLFSARANFLVLDEPTNHLDLESREALVRALSEYAGTILMVAHDRYLLGEVAGEVWSVGEDGITVHDEGFAAYEAAQAEANACRLDAPEAPAAKVSRQDDKERKRRVAEQRNALYRDIKPKREAMEAMEAELEALLAKQGEVEATMADPETYAQKELFSTLSKEYGALSHAAEDLLARMAVLEEEIGDLEARRAALGEGA